jgi:nucleotide-binding universal stress UspA family protein
VDKLTSILVVAGRTGGDRMLLDKAVLLARNLGARIFLYSCDAALAKMIHRDYGNEDARKAWQISLDEHLGYLRALRTAERAPDVQISVDAECASPLYEAVIRKSREIHSDLVMKSPSGSHPLRRFAFDSNDWHLIRECSATLMLVRHNPWKPEPHFGAMVDVADEVTARLAETILHDSEYLSLGCRGDLDVIYSERSADTEEQDEREAALGRLVREHHIQPTHVHVLSGDPEDTLPEFAGREHYDALLLGGLTHRKGMGPLIGTLTSKLVETLDTDFILIKRQTDAPVFQ